MVPQREQGTRSRASMLDVIDPSAPLGYPGSPSRRSAAASGAGQRAAAGPPPGHAAAGSPGSLPTAARAAARGMCHAARVRASANRFRAASAGQPPAAVARAATAQAGAHPRQGSRRSRGRPRHRRHRPVLPRRPAGAGHRSLRDVVHRARAAGGVRGAPRVRLPGARLDPHRRRHRHRAGPSGQRRCRERRDDAGDRRRVPGHLGHRLALSAAPEPLVAAHPRRHPHAHRPGPDDAHRRVGALRLWPVVLIVVGAFVLAKAITRRD